MANLDWVALSALIHDLVGAHGDVAVYS